MIQTVLNEFQMKNFFNQRKRTIILLLKARFFYFVLRCSPPVHETIYVEDDYAIWNSRLIKSGLFNKNELSSLFHYALFSIHIANTKHNNCWITGIR